MLSQRQRYLVCTISVRCLGFCGCNSDETFRVGYWNYKYKLATFAHQDIFSEGNTNKLLKTRNSVYSLRGSNKLILPRLRTDILRNSVTYRASTLWNNLNDCTTTVSDFNSFKKLVKEQLKSLTFLPICGKNDDFIYFYSIYNFKLDIIIWRFYIVLATTQF